jgi:hypothetical protein
MTSDEHPRCVLCVFPMLPSGAPLPASLLRCYIGATVQPPRPRPKMVGHGNWALLPGSRDAEMPSRSFRSMTCLNEVCREGVLEKRGRRPRRSSPGEKQRVTVQFWRLPSRAPCGDDAHYPRHPAQTQNPNTPAKPGCTTGLVLVIDRDRTSSPPVST